MDYFSYVLIFLVLVIIITYASIKVKYGFWRQQYVYHSYDIFKSYGIINIELPQKNKYTNLKQIETVIYSQMTPLQIQKFTNLIKHNYLSNGVFNQNICSFFFGHNDISFISFYNEEVFMNNLKTGCTISDNKAIGILTSKPIYLLINNRSKINATLEAYYIDYLCIDKLYRKKGISYQLMQTHEYNQRHINKKRIVSVFKREIECKGVVPLCKIFGYGFKVEKWTKPVELDIMYNVVEITSQNIHFLFDFIKMNIFQFDIIINTEVTNIIELIKTKNIFIYAIIVNDEIICCYFFKNTGDTMYGNRELKCVASIKNDSEYNKLNNIIDDIYDIFIQGFKISFWKIAADNYFGAFSIDSIAHNNIIIDNLVIRTEPSFIKTTYYYFYNFAYISFRSEKCLIIV